MAGRWRDSATMQQQWLYELLGGIEYDTYDLRNWDGKLILYKKIGYAFFDVPPDEPRSSNKKTGYGESMLEAIEKTAGLIQEANGERSTLQMAVVFVFVCCGDHGAALHRCPVFRVRVGSYSCKFVGSDLRTYSSWGDYVQSNQLPAGHWCWPEGGCYSEDASGNVRLGWGQTPAASPTTALLKGLDGLSLTASIGSTLVFGASLLAFPVAAPLMAAAGAAATATGVYSAARGVGTLADRSAHGQSVNPVEDREAAASWLGVVGSTVGLGAGAMASRAANMTRAGEVMGSASRAALNALSVTSLVINGVGVVQGAVFIKERYDAKKLTALDVFQFSASVLFFTHATVNFQTASSIINNTQRETMAEFEQSLRSNRHRKQYRQLVRDTASGMDPVEGNAKVIRSIRNIDNKDDFFAGMVRTRKHLGGRNVVFSENGNIIVNGRAEIHPMELYNMGARQRTEFLATARQASKGSVSATVFSDSADRLQLNARTSSSRPGAAGVEIEMQLVMLNDLRRRIPGANIEMKDVLLLVSAVSRLVEIVNESLLKGKLKLWRVVWEHVVRNVKMLDDIYVEAVSIARCSDGASFNEGEFNLANGIYMASRISQFIMNVLERLETNRRDFVRDIENALQEEEEEEDTV